jgi:hypothetical protein
MTKALKKHGGFSQGRLSRLPAWQGEMQRQESEKRLAKPKQERQLTPEMLENISKGENPAAIAEAREIAWLTIVDQASPDVRAELHSKSKQDQALLIDAYLDQQKHAHGIDTN